MAKKIQLEVRVPHVDIYMDHPDSQLYDPEFARKRIADMLRYDTGTILKEQRVGNDVVFVVECRYFHRERWVSFGLKVTRLN